MTSTPSACTKCQTPIPGGSSFCPGCGRATPTAIRQDTGAAVVPESTDASEADFRQRLQRALGDAYELRDLIGRGGFGAVYAALDVRLKREVAVKALRHDLFPTDSLVKRFQREAESVAKLRHPNIVPIYSIGTAEGFAYFIMPRIEGDTLATVLEGEEKLSLREAHRVFRELAGALAAAHRAGIIHRDIKPENVFLEEPERRSLLMDFGIAKSAELEDAKLTGTGMIVGTPHYMSPEQGAGDQHLDHRSDIYSLGVLAYQLFSGRRPFRGGSAQKLIVERFTTKPEDLDTVNTAVPTEISDAVMRCLEREPDDRWGSMANLIAVLDSVELPADTEAIDLATAAPLEPASRRLWTGLAVASGLAFLAYLALYDVHSPPAIDTPAVTEREALATGKEFLVSQGAVVSFESKSSVSFERQSEPREFLLTGLGFHGARTAAQGDVPIAGWHLRWFRRGEVEEWSVSVAGTGQVTAFTHTIAEGASGGRLSESEAQAVADSFLVANGWTSAELSELSAQSEQRPERTDHRFEWQVVGSEITWNPDDPDAGVGTIRVSVDVMGDRVAGYEKFLKLPDDYERSRDSFGFLEEAGLLVLIFGSFVAALALVMAPRRRRLNRWRPALVLTGLTLTLSLVGWINRFGDIVYRYDTDTPWLMFLWAELFDLAFVGLFLGVGVVVGAAASLSLGREVFPSIIFGFEDLLRGRNRLAEVVQPTAAGYLLGLLTIAASGLAEAAVRPLSAHSFSGAEGYMQYLGATVPVISTFSNAMVTAPAAALGVLLLVGVGKRYLRSTYAALTLFTIIAVLFEIPSIAGGSLDVVPVILVVWILALGLLRFGLVACTVAVYLFVLSGAFDLVRAGQTAFVVHGALAVALMCVPGFVVWLAHRRAQHRAATLATA